MLATSLPSRNKQILSQAVTAFKVGIIYSRWKNFEIKEEQKSDIELFCHYRLGGLEPKNHNISNRYCAFGFGVVLLTLSVLGD